MSTGRSICVKRLSRVLIGLAALALFSAGCGGDGNVIVGPVGDVAGVVFDTDGNIVRDADVFVENPSIETVSNSSGAYILRDVPAEDLIVRAEVVKDGVTYVGQNLARVFSNDRARNVNIVVVPTNRTAQIHGTVFDSGGDRIEGARVFAIGANNLSSAMAITDFNGNYTIRRLSADVDYELNASTPDFRSDGTIINLDPGEDQDEDFILSLETGISTLAPPNNLDAVAWTSPDESTRSTESASAYEQIKRLYDPQRAAKNQTITRLTPFGDIVEIDLTWDRVVSNFLLGYGVYTAEGASGTLFVNDFLRDPLAEFYADTNDSLEENEVYSYALTSINTDDEESVFSSRAVVETLGPVEALSPSRSPLTFRWEEATGAENYVVFLFDENPRIGVDSIFNNAGSPVAGDSLVYTGPALTPGHTYYLVVLGLANSNTSRTISRVISFTA